MTDDTLEFLRSVNPDVAPGDTLDFAVRATVAKLQAESEAAAVFARAESDRLKSAEHWKAIADRENATNNKLRSEVLQILVENGFRRDSYWGAVLPVEAQPKDGTVRRIEGYKYEAAWVTLGRVVTHLMDHAEMPADLALKPKP